MHVELIGSLEGLMVAQEATVMLEQALLTVMGRASVQFTQQLLMQ